VICSPVTVHILVHPILDGLSAQVHLCCYIAVLTISAFHLW